jgi:hypothetical protein
MVNPLFSLSRFTFEHVEWTNVLMLNLSARDLSFNQETKPYSIPPPQPKSLTRGLLLTGILLGK